MRSRRKKFHNYFSNFSFLGGLGVDRFVLGQTVLSLLKLFTAGGCGLWWFIDLFLIMGATKDVNAESAYRIYCQLRD